MTIGDFKCHYHGCRKLEKMQKSLTITLAIGDFKCRYHGCRQLEQMKKLQTITPAIGDFKCRYHGCWQLVKTLSYAAVLDNDNWSLYSTRASSFSYFSLVAATCLFRCWSVVVVPHVSAPPLLLGILINKFGFCYFNQVYSSRGRLYIRFEVVL